MWGCDSCTAFADVFEIAWFYQDAWQAGEYDVRFTLFENHR
jgi:hypothetical protein